MERQIVKIFDTTLRDGEQSPGATMNIEEKVMVARQLEKNGYRVMTAGSGSEALRGAHADGDGADVGR